MVIIHRVWNGFGEECGIWWDLVRMWVVKVAVEQIRMVFCDI